MVEDIYMNWSGSPLSDDYYYATVGRTKREHEEYLARAFGHRPNIRKKIKYLCEYCGRKYEKDEDCSCDYCGAPLKVLKDEIEDTL